jgi:hypothetical protein
LLVLPVDESTAEAATLEDLALGGLGDEVGWARWVAVVGALSLPFVLRAAPEISPRVTASSAMVSGRVTTTKKRKRLRGGSEPFSERHRATPNVLLES